MVSIWLVVLVGAVAVAAAALAGLVWRAARDGARALEGMRTDQEAQTAALAELRRGMQSVYRVAVAADAAERQRFDTLVAEFSRSGERMDGIRRETAASLDRNRDVVDAKLSEVQKTVERRLEGIRQDNAVQLEAMRQTVDERLSRTLNDRLSVSFKQVSDQLEAVSRGLGEMSGVAAGVGDLKRVLSGVKTRGILGEVQLGAILAEILAPEQYAENIATRPGSSERVEFAVKVPASGRGAGAPAAPVWLPIDSKFPGDTYEHLLDALDSADAPAIAAARKRLASQIRTEARDISTKYLAVPHTTAFGIMFLPFEGLYAEVVSQPGLIEELQRDYRVNVAGPSTMAAILNSLQMSYQTFAFQQRADEIQQVLAAVKAEFPKYQAELRRAYKQIETAGRTVDGIINTRTNVIERTLRDVTALDDAQAGARLLGLGDAESSGGASDETRTISPVQPGAMAEEDE